ncbi:YndJ family protein [Phytoactinopolyspora limicola]|uniref:YndJ family protein n=1 Tax=Phytoactinopolyspora limicola TaxID=2715536 RepID=UPI001407CDD8|nr:YndJ family protein [Phytoactinopolyspora limicola]
MTVLVGTIVALGMIVIVPLGLRLIDDEQRRLHPLIQIWPMAGVLGAVSLVLDRGALAAALATAYGVVTLWLAVLAGLRLLRRRSLQPAEIAVLTAMVTPLVAGSSLVAERAGYELFGFGMTILALTVAHFHFAGFAAALIAALVASTVRSVPAEIVALTVPAGTAIVLAGYFTTGEVELLGALVLSVGMWMLGWILWRRVRPAAATTVTRVLIGTSAVVVAVTMVLALNWALTHIWDDLPHLSLTWMAATHGVINAVGFALCGLLGWHRIKFAPAEVRAPA